MNGKKLSQMDRAKYHAANGYISETAAFFKQWYRREEKFKHRIKYNTKAQMKKNHHQQNKFVKEKQIASELLINAAYLRIRGIQEARC